MTIVTWGRLARGIRSLLGAAVLCSLVAVRGDAQDWPRIPPVGSVLRLETPSGRVTGTLLRFEPRSVVLEVQDAPRSVDLTDVLRAERRRRSTGTGALVGGAVGAAAFTGFLHLIVSALCESVEGCASDHRRAWGYGIVLGGAGGALLGAGVGSLIPRWEQVFPED